METNTKSVRAQINDLEIGASANFPIERYDYVVSCKTRLQTTTVVKRFSSKMDTEAQVVTITRNDDKPQ